MISQSRHIIQKQIIEIHFHNPGRTLGLENEVAEVFHEKLQPQLEVLLDEIFGNNYVATIDKLEIDCGNLDKKNWKQQFTDQTIRLLKTKLTEVNRKEINSKLMEENAAEAFFFFLEKGFMPWNNRFGTVAEVERKLKVNERLIARLNILIAKNEKVADRLASQFSEIFITQVIDALIKENTGAPEAITSFLKKNSLYPYSPLFASQSGLIHTEKNIFYAYVLKFCTANKNNNAAVQFLSYLLKKVDGNEELLKEIKQISHSLKPSEVVRKRDKMKDEPDHEKITEKTKAELTKIEQEGIYIFNSGLVLLHPFLQTLFENLGLTQNNDWIDNTARQIAVLVTEHLITGDEYPEEFNLVLNKILCSLTPDETVVTDAVLNDAMKEECLLLLNEVIAQWSVLKNTSVKGLRETFLQRDGKLSRIDNGWLLQVEQKPVDILLNHLPWGIGVIKLPWMKEMLFVEWN